MSVAIGATLLLGGIAVGGYWFWNQQAGVTIVHSNSDSTKIEAGASGISLFNS